MAKGLIKELNWFQSLSAECEKGEENSPEWWEASAVGGIDGCRTDAKSTKKLAEFLGQKICCGVEMFQEKNSRAKCLNFFSFWQMKKLRHGGEQKKRATSRMGLSTQSVWMGPTRYTLAPLAHTDTHWLAGFFHVQESCRLSNKSVKKVGNGREAVPSSGRRILQFSPAPFWLLWAAAQGKGTRKAPISTACDDCFAPAPWRQMLDNLALALFPSSSSSSSGGDFSASRPVRRHHLLLLWPVHKVSIATTTKQLKLIQLNSANWWIIFLQKLNWWIWTI